MAEAKARRTEAPEVRRRQILDAAKRKFAELGLYSTKMADVAAEAGVSVGMIYQYFPGKEALIEGIVQQDAEQQLARFGQIFDSEATSLREAIGMASDILRVVALDHERTALMLEVTAETARNPDLQRFAAELRDKVRPAMREKARRLKPPEWSFEELEARIDFYSGMLSSVIIRQVTDGRESTPELLRLMDQAVDWLFTPPGEKA